jgi:hypothetical protein
MSRRMITQKDQDYIKKLSALGDLEAITVPPTTNAAVNIVGGGDITPINLFLFGTSAGFAKAKMENNLSEIPANTKLYSVVSKELCDLMRGDPFNILCQIDNGTFFWLIGDYNDATKEVSFSNDIAIAADSSYCAVAVTYPTI